MAAEANPGPGPPGRRRDSRRTRAGQLDGTGARTTMVPSTSSLSQAGVRTSASNWLSASCSACLAPPRRPVRFLLTAQLSYAHGEIARELHGPHCGALAGGGFGRGCAAEGNEGAIGVSHQLDATLLPGRPHPDRGQVRTLGERANDASMGERCYEIPSPAATALAASMLWQAPFTSLRLEQCEAAMSNHRWATSAWPQAAEIAIRRVKAPQSHIADDPNGLRRRQGRQFNV